jgi:hypothetical protein
VTLDEFQQLVPPFEAAFHARMAVRRMDGKPCAARRFPVNWLQVLLIALPGSNREILGVKELCFTPQ